MVETWAWVRHVPPLLPTRQDDRWRTRSDAAGVPAGVCERLEACIAQGAEMHSGGGTMIYVDELRTYTHEGVPPSLQHGVCHLTADTLAELHAMAEAVGLRRAWYQIQASTPHYDLTASRRTLALDLGAIYVPARKQAIWRRSVRMGETTLALREWLELEAGR